MSSPNDAGNYHTTTTTTTVATSMYWDPLFLQTRTGLVKASKVIVNFIGFLCCVCSDRADTSRGNWFSFVSMTGFWATLIILFMYLFHAVEKLYFLPFMLGEAIFCAVWAFFYLIAAGLVAADADESSAFGAAAFFGFLAMVLYGLDAFLKFTGWRRNEVAQGERYTANVGSPTPF